MITYTSKVHFKNDFTIILSFEEDVKKLTFPEISEFKASLRHLTNNHIFQGKAQEIVPLFINNKSFLIVGLGSKKKLNHRHLRTLIRKAFLSSYLNSCKKIGVCFSTDSAELVIDAIESLKLGTYSWNEYKKTPDNLIPYADKVIEFFTTARKSFAVTEEATNGVTEARNLVNQNADIATSELFEKKIKNLIKGKKHISVKVVNEAEMKKIGLNLHLAVNQGSEKPPKLIIVHYQGKKDSSNSTAIVGKGLTFDTGGLNLKPTNFIETMRLDMGGAAAVYGALYNTVQMNLKKNIYFVFGMAENAIDAKSYKPGDVFTSYSGKTVEIGNTDAEGRLVLADAISYMVKNYQPKKIIDIATLTGACLVALGHDYSGLVSNDDRFAKQLLTAGEATDDRCWQLPLHAELANMVKSPIADIKNLGEPRSAAGTLTAAEFLHQFTEGTTWAHLDIAGTSFYPMPELHYYGYGATGSGVRLLTKYLQNAG